MARDSQHETGGSSDDSGEPLLQRRAQRASAAGFGQRLIALNGMINTYPDSATGYVLRGEHYLEAGFYRQAVSDFQAALQIAERQLQTERWGIVEQVMRDRASTGLRRAQQNQQQHGQPLSEQNVYEDTR